MRRWLYCQRWLNVERLSCLERLATRERLRAMDSSKQIETAQLVRLRRYRCQHPGYEWNYYLGKRIPCVYSASSFYFFHLRRPYTASFYCAPFFPVIALVAPQQKRFRLSRIRKTREQGNLNVEYRYQSSLLIIGETLLRILSLLNICLSSYREILVTITFHK